MTWAELKWNLRNWLLLPFSDPPREHSEEVRSWKRRWQWKPDYGTWNGRVFFGFACHLLERCGEAYDRHPTTCWALQLVYDPRKWQVRQFHGYYDGPHCAYQFGPFEFRSDGMNWKCKQCLGDSE